VIAQEHRGIRPEIGDESWPLGEIEGDALVVVIAEAAAYDHRRLIERKQTFGLCRDADARDRVEMQNALCVFASRVNSAMNGEARSINAVR